MNALLEGTASTTPFLVSSRIDISALNPDRSASDDEHIEATVVLVWPYSSSSQKLSLLLAENDVRLRKSRGQVRVTFEGECAQEVAKTHAGIGDAIRLGLKGVSWRETGDAVSTPGKKVDWDVEIRREVRLEVRRQNKDPRFLSFTARSPPPTREVYVQPASTQFNGKASLPLPVTPKLKNPLRISSGTYVDASLSPFADEDDYISGRSRKRTKYARHSGSWQLLDDDNDDQNVTIDQLPPSPISPVKQGLHQLDPSRVEHDTIDIVSPETAEPEGPIPGALVELDNRNEISGLDTQKDFDVIKMAPPMAAPPRPLAQGAAQMLPPLLPDLAQLVPLETPTLQPIPSPRLPLVSPMFQHGELSTEYFPVVPRLETTSSEHTGTRIVEGWSSPAFDAADQPSFTVEQASMVVEADGSTMLEEGVTMTDGMLISRQSTTLDSDNATSMALESFDNSDIQGLGEAYPELTAESVDLEALQQEIDRNSQAAFVSTPFSHNSQDQGVGDATRVLSSRSETQLRGNGPARMGSPQLVPEQIFDPSERPMVTLPVAQVDTELPHVSHQLASQEQSQFDGANSIYEQEDERIEFRAQAPLQDVGHKSTELVEISSDEEENSSEVDASEQADEGLRNEDPMIPDGTSTAVVRTERLVISPVDPKHGVLSETLNKQTLKTTPPVLTPVATQQSFTHDEVSNVNSAVPADVLPPTPQLTQRTSEVPVPTASQEQEMEGNLPEMPAVDEPKRTRQPAGRLTRKHFSSDTIGSEYFTPQRRRTFVQPLAEDIADDVHSAAIPSSPPASRRSTRRLSIAEQANVIEAPTTSSAKERSPRETVGLRRGISTNLSYYPRLASLDEFYGHEIDVFAICTADSSDAQKANSGPRDFNTTIHLADNSSDGINNASTTTTAQLFRPRKDALPMCKRGDAILLRNVKVQQEKLKPMLISTDTSAWAVFNKLDNDELAAKINGPPLEYGEAEIEHVKALMQWWSAGGIESYPARPTKSLVSNVVKDAAQSASIQPVSSSSSSKVTRAHLRDKQLQVKTQGLNPSPKESTFSEIWNKGAPPSSPTVRRSQRRRGKKSVSEPPQPITPTAAVANDQALDGQSEIDDTLTSLPTAKPTSQLIHPISPTVSTRSMRSNRSTRSVTSAAAIEVNTNVIAHAGASSTALLAATEPITEAVPGTPGKRKKRNRKKSDGDVPLQQDHESSQGHELRDGTKYADQENDIHQTRSRTHQRSKSSTVVHELRDGARYTD